MADSILDMLKKKVQGAAQSAGNAIMSGAPTKTGASLSAADELAKMEKAGPPDAMHYGSYQQRLDDLRKQVRGGK